MKCAPLLYQSLLPKGKGKSTQEDDKEKRLEKGEKEEMDILDFLLAMNLLARIVYDAKLRCKNTFEK